MWGGNCQSGKAIRPKLDGQGSGCIGKVPFELQGPIAERRVCREHRDRIVWPFGRRHLRRDFVPIRLAEVLLSEVNQHRDGSLTGRSPLKQSQALLSDATRPSEGSAKTPTQRPGATAQLGCDLLQRAKLARHELELG